mmetsp:Transcript_1777/g.3430  ORF Transcript_1777/g.3430 Transcript_1777/m.3430 type:complete len:83 (+) Transcript_1777:455-703(+)
MLSSAHVVDTKSFVDCGVRESFRRLARQYCVLSVSILFSLQGIHTDQKLQNIVDVWNDIFTTDTQKLHASRYCCRYPIMSPV